MTLTDTFELIGSAEAERSYSKAMRWRYGYGRGRRNAERSTDHASFDGAIAHFVDCLRTRAPFERDAAENRATLRLIEAGDLQEQQP